MKRHAPADYVATLTRLGFAPGTPGPVTRARAIDAASFVRDRRRALLAAMCGDQVVIEEAPPVLTAHAPDRPSEETAPKPPPVAPPRPVEPPIGPPLLPPQPPATPTQPADS
jgi:hypothetical protein